MSDGLIRVVVVDDQRLICESIAALLGLQSGITVVGTASNGLEALQVIGETCPDVALMDVRMPVMDGVTAVAKLAQLAPQCRVLMLTTFDDEDYVRGAIRAGASGYLLKDRPASELAAAIRTVHLGVAQFDPTALARIVSTAPARPATESNPSPLSDRERQVLRLIISGSTNREIAKAMHLSEGTVKNHVSRILDRLGVRHRTEAAIYGREHGLN